MLEVFSLNVFSMMRVTALCAPLLERIATKELAVRRQKFFS